MDIKSEKYLFGPVPSRRLGLSLGVDIVPLKTCTQNCLYCQLGKDSPQLLERKAYVPIDAVVDEIKARLVKGLRADYITISGSGEPTLHSQLGLLIDKIKAITTIPVAIITNGTLLHLADVRKDCCKANVVLPSLDAGDEQTFQKINQPHPSLKFSDLVDGLSAFRKEYAGQIWLEVFFCQSINTDLHSIDNISKIIARIKPDKVQLNTAVRPTAHKSAIAVSPENLQKIADMLGQNAEVIADFPHTDTGTTGQFDPNQLKSILLLLHRRPCSLQDICDGLGIGEQDATAAVNSLLASNSITVDILHGTTYYKP